MSYQPIKFSKEQYMKLKEVIKKDYGNVSMTKGIFLITFLYQKYVPRNIKEVYKRRYYVSSDKRRSGING